MKNLIAQSIGFAGLICGILSFQNKERKGILFFLILSSMAYFFHYMLLGALTGSVLNLIGAVRNYVFYQREKDWANKKIWLYLFIGIYLLSTFYTWKNYFSLLPLVAALIGSVSLWLKNPKYTRMIMLTTPPCWFTYNLVSGSIPGLLTEVFNFTSIIVGIVRFDIRDGSKEKN